MVCLFLFKQGSKPTTWRHEIKIRERLKIISETINPWNPIADFQQQKNNYKNSKRTGRLKHQDI